MMFEEFKRIEIELRSQEDINRVSKKFGYPIDVIRSIYSNKLMRNTIKKYNLVKKNVNRIIKEWENGRSINSIAIDYEFSPVMMARIIFQHWGWKKSRIMDILDKPAKCRETRLKNEIEVVLQNDIGYSPEANSIQSENGARIEDNVGEWLDKNNIKYLRQEDLVDKYEKTPDFLLEKEVNIENMKIKWVECKANFGGWFELNRVFRKQVGFYREMFGEGMLVHWLGYIEDYRGFKEGILVKDRTYFNSFQ